MAPFSDFGLRGGCCAGCGLVGDSLREAVAAGGFIWQLKEGFRRDEHYQPVYGRMVKGGAFNQTFEFPGVPAKEAMATLPRIAFEVRAVHWVEFQNVALDPRESGRDGRIAPATPPTPPGMRL